MPKNAEKRGVGKVFQKSNERKRQKCTWNPKRGKNASRNTAIPHSITFLHPLLLQPTKNGDWLNFQPPAFPYTLDHKIFHDCMIPPCPTKVSILSRSKVLSLRCKVWVKAWRKDLPPFLMQAFPGLWELPLVMWNDHRDGRCSMADACSNPPDAEVHLDHDHDDDDHDDDHDDGRCLQQSSRCWGTSWSWWRWQK